MDSTSRLINELEVNNDDLQSLQDSFCKANDMYMICIGRKRGQLTSFSGSKPEEDFVDANFPESLRKELIESFVDGAPENIVERAGTEDYFLYRSVAFRGEKDEVVGKWLCFAVDKDKVPAGKELPVSLRKTTLIQFDKAIALLETFSKHFVTEILRNEQLKKKLSQTQSEEKEVENKLIKNELMTEILRLMESDDSFTNVANEILAYAGKYIECTNTALVQMSVDGQTADMILEWNMGDDKLSPIFQGVPVKELPFMNGKPYTISSDAALPDAFMDFFGKYAIKSAILLPINVDDEAAMYLCFLSVKQDRQWTVDEIRFSNDIKNILHSILIKKITANSLAGSYSALESILQNAGYGVVVVDSEQKQVLYKNDTFGDMFDNSIDSVAVEELIFNKNYSLSELNGYSANGSGKWFDISVADIRWVDSREVRLITFYDTTDIRNYQKKAEKQAQTDTLTGLFNRQACEKDIAMEYHIATKLGKEFAVLMFDIDNFTTMNQGLGYRIGDDLLEFIAHSIDEISYVKGKCYRIGGDEFAVLVDHENIKNLDIIIKRIMNLFDNPWVLDDKEYFCTISMGGLKAPENISDASAILTRLTIALHGSKEKSHNSFQFYNEEAEVIVAEKQELEDDLKKAVKHGCREFVVYYQPIMEFVGGVPSCCGAEALVRWNSEDRGLVMPSGFITEAEEQNLIGDIGHYVLLEAAKSCKHWNDFGHPEYKINVNISPVQLVQKDFVDRLDAVLKQTAINPKNLTLEVADDFGPGALPKAVKALDAARALGCRVALDNFGASNSALNNIKNLPIDTIKIDRTYAKDMQGDTFAQSFVKTVAELANSVDVDVCVEGVEEDKQITMIGDYPINLVQGFFFDKPLSKEEFGKKYI
ncbi:bifunctional diguanylate cyclase/phosphodiesterase [Pseudobutyrivibrio xylanivorans]|uniref:Diguanylate cyclase (GGDEF) domain-containing protein n=1 Tax=Pseudobutyrivibrio xylanivorans TaxID=185007 RepID=A0A1G5RRX0_PSEXY|nr:EAL domain-containing protein [Pseudobutyrivibrio xylanivorans]SCZ76812.1 diguanylate cyclase (GGDEF) domain-containing protein [Pseudobutyrivibrio xylanivorans]